MNSIHVPITSFLMLSYAMVFLTPFLAIRQNSIARKEIIIKERMVTCQPYNLLTYAIPNEEMELPMYEQAFNPPEAMEVLPILENRAGK